MMFKNNNPNYTNSITLTPQISLFSLHGYQQSILLFIRYLELKIHWNVAFNFFLGRKLTTVTGTYFL